MALGFCLVLMTLAAGGCGRRGKLEPPSGAVSDRGSATSAPVSARALPTGVGAIGGATPEAESVRAGEELPLSATAAGAEGSAPIQTGRGARKGYTIPKEPFILDPIL